LRELRFSFARSSGPGGQNVNKLNTKAMLRWKVAQCETLPENVRDRFLKTYRRRITNDGELILTSQRFRDQGRNVADCLEKLRTMLLEVSTAPRKRKPTRLSKAQREKRLENKRQQAEKKRRRTGPRLEE
jgi:ribosome-associated protein